MRWKARDSEVAMQRSGSDLEFLVDRGPRWCQMLPKHWAKTSVWGNKCQLSEKHSAWINPSQNNRWCERHRGQRERQTAETWEEKQNVSVRFHGGCQMRNHLCSAWPKPQQWGEQIYQRPRVELSEKRGDTTLFHVHSACSIESCWRWNEMVGEDRVERDPGQTDVNTSAAQPRWDLCRIPTRSALTHRKLLCFRTQPLHPRSLA